MAQAKVVSAGFRGYQVLKARNFDGNVAYFDKIVFAERVLVRNHGDTDIKLRFNHPVADSILIPKNSSVDLPLKTNKVFLAEGSTTDLEIIGYFE